MRNWVWSSLVRRRYMPWQHLVNGTATRKARVVPGIDSKRIFHTVRRGRVCEFLMVGFKVLRCLLLIDVLDQQGVHDLPLSVFPGCQLWIIQQLVDHGQVMFFALAKKKRGRKGASMSM